MVSLLSITRPGTYVISLRKDIYHALVGNIFYRNFHETRIQAWEAVCPIREKAANALTAGGAADCFERQFARNLVDLEDLYANDNWRHAKTVGGHEWRHVTALVVSLRDTIERG